MATPLFPAQLQGEPLRKGIAISPSWEGPSVPATARKVQFLTHARPGQEVSSLSSMPRFTLEMFALPLYQRAEFPNSLESRLSPATPGCSLQCHNPCTPSCTSSIIAQSICTIPKATASRCFGAAASPHVPIPNPLLLPLGHLQWQQ